MAAADQTAVVGRKLSVRVSSRAAGALRLCVVPLVLLVGWQLLAWTAGDVAVATPAETIRAIGDGLHDGWLLEGLEKTAVATLLSFAIAVAIGGFLGVLLGLNAFWAQVLESPLLWIYAIPKITLYPIFLLFFGLTLDARVAFAVFHGFIPLVLILLNGLRSIPPVYFKVARVNRLSRRKVLTRVVLPSSLPAVLVGMRYCFSLTFLGVVLAEMFAAREGTGYTLLQSISLHQVPRTFGIALVLVLIALAINGAFVALTGIVERRRGGQVGVSA